MLLATEKMVEAERLGYDVHAFYQTAKRAAASRKSRNFFKDPQGKSSDERNKAIQEAKDKSTCNSCQQRGHWTLDKVCPNYAKDMAEKEEEERQGQK